MYSSFFSFYCSDDHRDLPSFPTRRSSDLVEIPLQAYFRINTENMGQFERTLIIADEGSHVGEDRKSTRLNSSHVAISYAVFCLKKKTIKITADNTRR